MKAGELGHIIVCLLSCACLFGCATVHQPPGVDPDKMTKFRIADGISGADTSGTSVEFELSIDEAIAAISEACYEFEIPLYYPLVAKDEERAWLVSGPFIAVCKRDCECGKEGAAGHGADLASGTVSINLVRTMSTTVDRIAVEISSMFFRTQSTGGEYGSTQNLYFESSGRIESGILQALGSAEERRFHP